MSDLTLETLPSEVIVEILCSLYSIHDLDSVIAASKVCYNLFANYSTSISNRVALTTIGEDAWDDAAAVMIYQRQIYLPVPDCAAIKKDQESKFVLRLDDLPQLIHNQDFYHCCAEDYYSWASLSSYRSQAPTPEPDSSAPVLPPTIPATNASNPTTNQNPATSAHTLAPVDDMQASFLESGIIPVKLFYRMWLLHIQFGYEKVSTFIQRPQLTRQEIADFRVVSRIIFFNRNSQEFGCTPLARWDFARLGSPFPERWNRFWDSQIAKIQRCRFHGCFGDTRVLRMKMMYQLRGKTSKEDFPMALRAFLMDFAAGVDARVLIERYGLDEGCV